MWAGSCFLDKWEKVTESLCEWSHGVSCGRALIGGETLSRIWFYSLTLSLTLTHTETHTHANARTDARTQTRKKNCLCTHSHSYWHSNPLTYSATHHQTHTHTHNTYTDTHCPRVWHIIHRSHSNQIKYIFIRWTPLNRDLSAIGNSCTNRVNVPKSATHLLQFSVTVEKQS